VKYKNKSAPTVMSKSDVSSKFKQTNSQNIEETKMCFCLKKGNTDLHLMLVIMLVIMLVLNELE